jgi:hypothetical protein
VVPTNQADSRQLTLGKIAIPDHFLVTGVSTFNGTRSLQFYSDLPQEEQFHIIAQVTKGSTRTHCRAGAAHVAATVIAYWSNGFPLIAEMPHFPGRVVTLNFFPPSADTDMTNWESGGDGGKMMVNALLFVANMKVKPS